MEHLAQGMPWSFEKIDRPWPFGGIQSKNFAGGALSASGAEVIPELDSEEWVQGSAMDVAFALTQDGSWVASEGWVGQSGALDRY